MRKERKKEEDRLKKKLKDTAPARKQADIVWRKHYHPRHVDWERRRNTVEKRRAKNHFTKLGKNFKDK